MLINLLLGVFTMTVCLIFQSVMVLVALNFYIGKKEAVNNPSFVATVHVLCSVMSMLVIGNLLQIGAWALLFVLLGEFVVYSEAFYHSAVNFATLGYGDIVMSARYKLLGPIEAINGVLMIGVSTAALLSLFQDSLKKTFHARKTDQEE